MFICQSNKSKQQYTHNTHKCFDHTNSESNGETQKGQQIITYIQYGISQFKIYLLRYHCRQRAPVGIVLSSSVQVNLACLTYRRRQNVSIMIK